MAARKYKITLKWACQYKIVFSDKQLISIRPTEITRKMATSRFSAENKDTEQEHKAIRITPLEEAHRFMQNCFIAVGAPSRHAKIVADNLIEADYRGHYSHGMNRLGMYINDIKSTMCDAKAEPTIEKQNVATALVNGNNGLGAVIGKFCMDLAIEKAKAAGIGMVVAHGSNHYGIAGIYPLHCIKEGLLGLAFTNTSPLMAPTRAKKAALGTNPLSLGAPGREGDYFLLDMATTAVAVGKIELAKRKGIPLPEGWALNEQGQVETNAGIAYDSKRLMPLGGREESSGYKGYGLGFLVEVLCGILSGSAYGPNIRSWGDSSKTANLGHAFIAIDPKVFAPGFEGRLTDLMQYLRNMEPADPEKPVLVQGDPEKQHMAKVDKDGGLRYVKNQHDTNEKLAKELNVCPMVSKYL